MMPTPARCACRGECGVDHDAEGTPAWWIRENLERRPGPAEPAAGGGGCPALEGHDHPVTGSASVRLRTLGIKKMCHRCIARIDGPRRAGKAAETRRERARGPKLPGAYWGPAEGGVRSAWA